MYQFDPLQYHSPRRVWDIENQAFTDQWVTVSGFDITLPDGRHIHVPEGFMYDKASIPRMVWWWMPRDDRYVLIAALIHDYLYDEQQIEGEWIYRKEADQIFYDLLRQMGMRWSKAKAAHCAVRMGGWRWYNARAKNDLMNPLYTQG